MSFKSKIIFYGLADISENVKPDSQAEKAYKITDKSYELIVNGIRCTLSYKNNPVDTANNFAIIEGIDCVTGYDDKTHEVFEKEISFPLPKDEAEALVDTLDSAGMNGKIEHKFSNEIISKLSDAKKQIEKGKTFLSKFGSSTLSMG